MLVGGAELELVIRPDGYCWNLRAFVPPVYLLPSTGILFSLELLSEQGNIKSTVFSILNKQIYKSYGILETMKIVSCS